MRSCGKFGVMALTCLAVGLAGSSYANEGAEAKDSLVIEGSSTVGPISEAFAEYYMKRYPNVNITVGASGSGNGAKALIRGTCDIADLSRFMKQSEFKAAIDNGVLPVAHVVAVDGIAIVVHPSNPVAALTLAQVRDIYAGKIRKWSEVGGPNADIVVISRDQNSGTYETFEDRVMQGTRIDSGAEKVGSNGAIRGRVSTTPAAIGYVGIGYTDRKLKALTIDGVKPTRASIANGEYAIARPLFMFTNGYPNMGTHVHRFVTLHLTREGQALVEEAGFVPVTDYPEPALDSDH